MYLVELENVWFRYSNGTWALKGVECSVREGEVVALLGPNGSGKTTTLLLMAALLLPTRGTARFRGVDTRKLRVEMRRDIGLVFQDPDDQLFNPTVYDEVAFALRQLGLADGEVDARVRKVARMLGIEHLLGKSPFRLSYGERKKVAIASVIAYEPSLLLLDEPTASLSPKYAMLVESIVKEWACNGRACVLATQNVGFARRVADRAYVVLDGRVVAEGPIDELVADYSLLEKAELAAQAVVERECEARSAAQPAAACSPASAVKRSPEDCVKAIYILKRRSGTVSAGDLSSFLNAKPADVARLLKRLAAAGLVSYEYGGGRVDLTDKGLKTAEKLIKEYECIRDFLVKVLGVPEDIADVDAYNMERYLHPETIKRLKTFMNLKGKCPT